MCASKHWENLTAALLGTQSICPSQDVNSSPMQSGSSGAEGGWGEATATTSGDLIGSWHYDVTGLAF